MFAHQEASLEMDIGNVFAAKRLAKAKIFPNYFRVLTSRNIGEQSPHEEPLEMRNVLCILPRKRKEASYAKRQIPG
jgi:hypothetical protein